MWHTLVLVVHVIVAFALIGLVLLQRGKGAEAGTGFGAGASGTVFGARGSANFLSRSTAILATLFFATCLGLVYLSTKVPVQQSIFDKVQETSRTAPNVVSGPPSIEDEQGPPQLTLPPSTTQDGGGDPASGSQEGDGGR